MAKKGKLKPRPDSPVIENRRAYYDYEISDTLEVGIALRGSEVKSIRAGQVSIAEGYVRATAEPPDLTLHGVMVAEYGPSGPLQHRTTRTRALLAHTREIIKLARQSQVKGATIVPLKLYFNSHGYAKLLIGVAFGRKRSDKRHAIAERETKRDVARALSKRL